MQLKLILGLVFFAFFSTAVTAESARQTRESRYMDVATRAAATMELEGKRRDVAISQALKELSDFRREAVGTLFATRATLVRGDLLLDQKQYSDALKEYEIAQKEFSDESLANNYAKIENLGYLHLKMGDTLAAMNSNDHSISSYRVTIQGAERQAPFGVLALHAVRKPISNGQKTPLEGLRDYQTFLEELLENDGDELADTVRNMTVTVSINNGLRLWEAGEYSNEEYGRWIRDVAPLFAALPDPQREVVSVSVEAFNKAVEAEFGVNTDQIFKDQINRLDSDSFTNNQIDSTALKNMDSVTKTQPLSTESAAGDSLPLSNTRMPTVSNRPAVFVLATICGMTILGAACWLLWSRKRC